MNEYIDKAQVEAILAAGQPEVNRYLVTCAVQTKHIMDDLPESIVGAVSDAVAACRAETEGHRERVDALWTARTEVRGIYRFWSTMGKILAAACALAGLIVTLTHFIA